VFAVTRSRKYQPLAAGSAVLNVHSSTENAPPYPAVEMGEGVAAKVP
jgi:hypothetical protein